MRQTAVLYVESDAAELYIRKVLRQELSDLVRFFETGKLDLGSKLCGRDARHEPHRFLLACKRPGDVDGYLARRVAGKTVEPPCVKTFIVEKPKMRFVTVGGDLDLVFFERECLAEFANQKPFVTACY